MPKFTPSNTMHDGDPCVTPNSSAGPYVPPLSCILDILGLNGSVPESGSITVSAKGLRLLISNWLASVSVDDSYYLSRYPDVHAAILADVTPSPSAHFRLAGYLEGRLPAEPPFDSEFYSNHYQDIASAYAGADELELAKHFKTKGYYEGRAGISEHLEAAEKWRAASIEINSKK